MDQNSVKERATAVALVLQTMEYAPAQDFSILAAKLRDCYGPSIRFPDGFLMRLRQAAKYHGLSSEGMMAWIRVHKTLGYLIRLPIRH